MPATRMWCCRLGRRRSAIAAVQHAWLARLEAGCATASQQIAAADAVAAVTTLTEGQVQVEAGAGAGEGTAANGGASVAWGCLARAAATKAGRTPAVSYCFSLTGKAAARTPHGHEP